MDPPHPPLKLGVHYLNDKKLIGLNKQGIANFQNISSLTVDTIRYNQF